MAIDRTVKFTVRLNMLNPAHVTINKVLNELNLDIFKSKNQFFIDAATYYIENYGQEELTQPKKEKEPEFVSTEEGNMCVLRKRYWMQVVTSVMAVRLSEKARSMRKKSFL